MRVWLPWRRHRRLAPARSTAVAKEAEQRALDAIPRFAPGRYAALAAGEVVRRGAVGVLSDALRQRHRRGGAGRHAHHRRRAQQPDPSSIASRPASPASQLVTDFGRTGDLVQTQQLRADAQEQDVDARRAEVLLQVDRAYFDALRAQAVLRVAQQTVEARQLVVDQVTALAASGLKSGLDVSFARVNLSQAQLLLVQAQNDVQASFAALATAMGSTAGGDLRAERRAAAAAPPSTSVGRSSRRRSGIGRTSPRERLSREPPPSSPRPSARCGFRRSPPSARPALRRITRSV